MSWVTTGHYQSQETDIGKSQLPRLQTRAIDFYCKGLVSVSGQACQLVLQKEALAGTGL